MVAKCKLFVGGYIKLYRHLQNQICVETKKHLSDHGCQRTNVAFNCKIFVTTIIHFIGISIRYTCFYNFKSSLHKWKKKLKLFKQGEHS